MMTYTKNKSREKTKNNNTVDPYRPTQGIKAKCLDAYDWKQYLSDIAFSDISFITDNVRQSQVKIKLTAQI